MTGDLCEGEWDKQPTTHYALHVSDDHPTWSYINVPHNFLSKLKVSMLIEVYMSSYVPSNVMQGVFGSITISAQQLMNFALVHQNHIYYDQNVNSLRILQFILSLHKGRRNSKTDIYYH